MTAQRISVIIPVYNGARYLAAAIDSVLGQTLKASEVIVVDDGSSDGSGDVARSYEPRVRAVSIDHAGSAAAANHGVNLAAGPLIAFLDADDLWTAGKLETQMAAFQSSPPPDMVFGWAQNFREGATAEEAIPGISRGTLLISKRRWFDVGPLDETLVIGEFVDWFARSQEAGVRFLTVNEVLLNRRIHESNTGVRSASSRSQYALVAKRALDRRRARAGS